MKFIQKNRKAIYESMKSYINILLEKADGLEKDFPNEN
jgi:hypothetical protein